jgi:hypothetical protein
MSVGTIQALVFFILLMAGSIYVGLKLQKIYDERGK